MQPKKRNLSSHRIKPPEHCRVVSEPISRLDVSLDANATEPGLTRKRLMLADRGDNGCVGHLVDLRKRPADQNSIHLGNQGRYVIPANTIAGRMQAVGAIDVDSDIRAQNIL